MAFKPQKIGNQSGAEKSTGFKKQGFGQNITKSETVTAPINDTVKQILDIHNNYGKPSPPPAYGSGYSKFLDWASDGLLEPSDEERALAMKAWSNSKNDMEVRLEIQSPSMKM